MVAGFFLTWFAKTRLAIQTSLPDGSWLVRFLGEWLWDWTRAFFGNGATKERLIYTYIEYHLKMVERGIGNAPDFHCEKSVQVHGFCGCSIWYIMLYMAWYIMKIFKLCYQ